MAKKTKKTAKKTPKKSLKKTATKSITKKLNKKTAVGKAKATAKVSARAVVGQAVPGWAAPATGDKVVTSDSLRGQKIVLYFYPKDKTPGCTMEGHDFTKLHQAFRSANAEVFGISRDTLKLHESFKECENYSIDLLSDEDEKLCKIFDVIKMKNMYGKQVRGIERSTFVIDASGRLVKEWRGVKVPGHAEEVLNYVKGLED